MLRILGGRISRQGDFFQLKLSKHMLEEPHGGEYS